MEAIATGLTVEAAKAITKVVGGRAFEEMKLIWGFKDELEKLKRKFTYIQAFLTDLESRKLTEKSHLVEMWLVNVKEVAYAAENLLDDHAYEMLRRKIELNTSTSNSNSRPTFKKKCGYYMRRPSTSPVVFRIRMTHRVKWILSKLEEVNKDAHEIGLQQVPLAREAAGPSTQYGDALYQARKYAGASVSEFIGREQDMEVLLQRILNPTTTAAEAGLIILAIVGIGGLGKTTLASRLFKHEEVEGKFAGNKAWICVSEIFNVDNILKEMVESLKSIKCDFTNSGATIKPLEEELKGKKFFLVLDDVWNDDEELWNSFKSVINNIGGLAGSVLLITTRKPVAARKARVSYLHELKGLSEEDGWALFVHQVFDETMQYDSSFDDVGRRIVEKCKGVPLAIKSIGGLLRSKQQYNSVVWESIEKSELWGISENDKSSIMPSLLLSYNHMDHVYVKQCFAYCAIFPKDSVMEKNQLISLWLAEGLLHNESEVNNFSATPEMIGEKYIDILMNHSFLQQEEIKYRGILYKMHDLVHDLASYVSKNHLLVWKTGDKLEHVDNSQLRHLVLNLENNRMVPEFLVDERMRKLRTIMSWHGIPRWKSLICCPYLRILDLVDVGLTEIPSLIGELVHLRYLDLSENCIEALPGSICKLYQLQTLRLLRCFLLKELPVELHKLKNIRHINTSSPIFASTGLGLLTSLQILPRLELQDRKGWTIDELGPLNQAKGDLHIKGLEFVMSKEKAREADIGGKREILNLNLEWGLGSGDNDDEDVLDGLEPHQNIQSLRIRGFGGKRFPWWISSMSVKQRGHPTQLRNLKEVCLSFCRRCEKVPSLGQLPHLNILRLDWFFEVECIGEEFYKIRRNNMISDVEVPSVGAAERKLVFPALKKIYITNFEKLATWMPPSSAQATAFPKLETLEIEDCGRLEMVPALQYESLKHLILENLGSIQPLDIIRGSDRLSTLEILGMKGCKQVPSLGQLPNLTILRLDGFDEVECIGDEFYEIKKNNIISNDGNEVPHVGAGETKLLFPSLRELYIDNFDKLAIWMPPSSAQATTAFPKLETLKIEGCRRLEIVPAICHESLKRLALNNVGCIQHLDIFKGYDGLTTLEVWGTKEMVRLPEELSNNYRKLQKLVIEDCEKVKCIPSGMISLKELSVWRCPSIESIGDSVLQGLSSSLRQLSIGQCSALKRIPKNLQDCTSLEFLDITDCPLIDMDEEEDGMIPDIGNLQRLTWLTMYNAGRLIAGLLRWVPQLDRLRELEIGGWREAEEWDMTLLTSTTFASLTSLTLRDIPNLKKQLPAAAQTLLPPSLTDLKLENIWEMEQLPDWIASFSSLQFLWLENCNKLKYLPSKPAILRLSRFRSLYIIICPLLGERCDKHNNGPESEWHKISHLPDVRIE